MHCLCPVYYVQGRLTGGVGWRMKGPWGPGASAGPAKLPRPGLVYVHTQMAE